MEGTFHRPAWKTLLAFAIIYFVWGSTFLAIRVGVREVPPLLFASMPALHYEAPQRQLAMYARALQLLSEYFSPATAPASKELSK